MVRRVSWRLGVVVALAAALGSVRPAGARSVISLSWQALVLRADLVAEVECTVAGGIVAKYRVVTVWKGTEKPGEEIRLRITPDMEGFPVATVGQRFIVAVNRRSPEDNARTLIRYGIPAFCRNLEAQYQTPLFQGMTLLEAGDQKKVRRILDADFESVEAFGQAVQALAKEPPEVQEKLRLDPFLMARRRDLEPGMKAAQQVVAESRTVEETQKGLEKLGTPEAAELLKAVERFIKDREAVRPRGVGGGGGGGGGGMPAAKRPTEEKIREAIQALEGPQDYRMTEAVELLTGADTEKVVEFLLTWENKEKKWWNADRGYAMGSYFGQACPAEGRKGRLVKLLEAKDPDIRVAAAVYLAFEDLPGATAKLKEFTKLEGDAGAWAAITLARRGDAAALPRALEVFQGEGHTQGRLHFFLQGQMVVLLSNSAAAGGAEQPPVHVRALAEGRNHKKEIEAWYAREGGKLKLVEPWGEELARKRAD